MILFPVDRRLLVGAVAVFMLTSMASAAPVVTLPAHPPATRTAALEEIWRMGGEEDEDILLGLVGGGVMGDDGNTYIIDRQLSQVLVMSPDGELLDTLGREGEGPGEFRRGNGLFLTPTGVGVVQGFPGKVILINRDGTPGGEMSVGDSTEGGFRFVRRLYFDGEHMVALTGRTTFGR